MVANSMRRTVFLSPSDPMDAQEARRVRCAEAGLTLARTEQPDLVLMDIQLPGMDGLEACAILKKNVATRDIPVIALTALAMKGDEERIRAAGCDGYIAKPLAYREFLTTIAARLQKTAV